MRSVNTVLLLGNLGSDPELRETSGGKAVATLSLATNRKWKSKDGEPQEKTEWHRVVAWGKTAEFAYQHLAKGDPVFVEGSIEYRSWTDQEGHARYTTEIVAREVISLSTRDGVARSSRGPSPNAKVAEGEAVYAGTDKFPEALEEEDELPF